MIIDIKKNNKCLITEGEEERVEISNNNVTSPYDILVRELGYAYSSLDFSNISISKKLLKDFFEPVENINLLGLTEDNLEIVAYRRVFKSKKYDTFLELWEDSIKNNNLLVDKVYYKIDNLKLEEISKFLNTVLTFKENNNSTVFLAFKNEVRGLIFKQFDINPLNINLNTMYNDSFKEVNDLIVKELKEGKKGVILLHGEPGTGKTNYIKNLTKELPDKEFIFIPSSMIPDLSNPTIISKLYEKKGCILILEDTEEFIKSRDAGGFSTVVSSILNLSDGFLSDILNIQIICTFNTDLKNVDKALLRKGRLIAEYKFDKLNTEKSNNLLKELGYKHTTSEPLSLSEIFNFRNKNFNSKERKKIGF